MQENVTKKKNANIELLRIISMIMIIFLHALGKGKLLVSLIDYPTANAAIAWLLEALSISAVNIFMLISGYFLINSQFKLRRLIELVCECIFYSLGAFLVCLACGVDTGEEIDIYFLLHTIFPIHMDLYWFMTAYVVVYMLLPLISAGVKALSQKQFGTMIIVLIIFESVFKSVLPVRLEEDQNGYNFLWFLIVFLIGAYFRLYGFKHLRTSSKGALTYFGATALILLEGGLIGLIQSKTGHLEEISLVSLEYNHIFVLVAAIGIFAAFINKREMGEKTGKIICFLSPMSLGVYLFHENLSLRYNWQKWLGIYDTISLTTWQFLGKLLLSVLIIYVAGTIIDFVRIKLFKLIRITK